MMIEIESLHHAYGSFVALHDLTLSIAEGEVFGLIGPNGAGKTTTLSILATLLRPTRGEVRIHGHALRIEAARIRSVIGYMPDFAGMYEDMRVDEYLHFFAAASGVAGSRAGGIVRDVLELTDLTVKAEAMVETLSRGMRQRLGVARVLLHDPAVLLLDEPASGLDPKARVEMRHLLLELKAMGKTVVISSHILSELAEICTSIGILEQGRFLYTGGVEGLLREMRRPHIAHVRVTTASGDPLAGAMEAKAVLEADERVERVKEVGDVLEVRIRPDLQDRSFLCGILVEGGLQIHHFTEEPLTLEDAFMRLTGHPPTGEDASSSNAADTPANGAAGSQSIDAADTLSSETADTTPGVRTDPPRTDTTP